MIIKHQTRCCAQGCRTVIKVKTLEGDVDAGTIRLACKGCKVKAKTKEQRRALYVTGGES